MDAIVANPAQHNSQIIVDDLNWEQDGTLQVRFSEGGSS